MLAGLFRARRPNYRSRRLAPTIDVLEDRQLMASQLLMGHASFLQFTVLGTNTTPQDQPPLAGRASFDTAIGSQWTIQDWMIARPSEWDPHPCDLSVAEVDYTTPASLSLNSDVDAVSSQIRTTGATHVLPDWTFQDSLGGYFDESTGQKTFTVDIKYNGHSNGDWPDDVFTIDLNVLAPKGTLNTTFPPPTGNPGAFHFGIWQKNTQIAGQYEEMNTPIGWDDPHMLAATSGDPRGYKIGVQSPGPPGMNMGDINFSADVQNTTPVDGFFSINQVATVDATTQDVSANNSTFKAISTYQAHSPRDANGNQIWGRDSQPDSDMSNYRLLVPAWTVATLSQPGKNYNYFDNPSMLYAVSSNANQFLTFTDYHLKLETDLVWTPIGGMPIVISKQPWSLDVNEDNKSVRDNPTVGNMLNPNNWVGHADMNHDPAIQNTPQLMQPYQYNIPALLDNADWVVTNLYVNSVPSSPDQMDITPIPPTPPSTTITTHDPSQGWIQMPDGHWWNVITGEGYQDGDVLPG